jgi:hypothetical protein
MPRRPLHHDAGPGAHLDLLTTRHETGWRSWHTAGKSRGEQAHRDLPTDRQRVPGPDHEDTHHSRFPGARLRPNWARRTGNPAD